MQEDKRIYWITLNTGRKIPDLEAMLAKLLDESVVFIYAAVDEHKNEVLAITVNANDIFVPAADAEDVTEGELPELFDLFAKHGDSGTIIWLCLKRKEQPMKRFVEMLKKEGLWTEELESLEKNKL